MRKAVKITLLLVILFLLTVPLAMAAGHQTIVEIAAGDENFETLVAAVTAADLADELSSGEWTVFAPTDAAFAKLDLTPANIAREFTKAELADILLYHVVDEEMSSADLKANQGNLLMANNELAGIKYYDGDIYVNDYAKVVDANILASNGVIHVVDNVILGPWPRDETGDEAPGAIIPAGNTIAAIAAGDDRFDTLVAAVTAAGLADELAVGDWTVFAPTDDAFAKLDLTPDNIAREFTKDELADILLYHLVDGGMSTADLKANQGDTLMANNQLAGVKYYDGDIYVNDDAKVVDSDIVASNGVIHAVDTVILGPWPRE